MSSNFVVVAIRVDTVTFIGVSVDDFGVVSALDTDKLLVYDAVILLFNNEYLSLSAGVIDGSGDFISLGLSLKKIPLLSSEGVFACVGCS